MFGKVTLPVVEYSKGNDVTVVTFGGMVKESLAAARSMTHKHGMTIQVLSCPQLKPFPDSLLLEMITSRHLVVVEELNPYGGFSGMVCKALFLAGPERRGVHVLSAADRFAGMVGNARFQRRATGLTQEFIEQSIGAVLENI
jgi:transketolase C-terminal domain/subunit